ncbi:hypothetical protein [Streptomyces sp. NPDC048669]|uniref:hypothetical protein n=1 Tax=Streptomyces sp. NPDC048669 TaxID=3155267 RepID=UPI003443548A
MTADPPAIPSSPIESEPAGYCSNAEQHAILRDTLHAAGVELGAYDRSIVDWLTVSPGWEWATVATIASWVKRGSGSPRAELADRAAENRELRREAGRAADLIEAGEHAQAVALLRYISRPATT